MTILADLIRQTTSTAGTGTITLGAAVSGFRTIAGAGIADGSFVSYSLFDNGNSNRETGTGIVGSNGTTLTRLFRASSTGSLLNLSGSAIVAISPNADDFDFATTLSSGKIFIVIPGYSESMHTTIGGNFQVMATEVGQVVSPTNLYTRNPRRRSSSTPSGSGQTCGFRARNGGSVTRRDIGFRTRLRFGIGDTGPTARMFVGYAANGFLQGTNAEPSTFTEIIGIGCQSGGTTLSWYENDASGTATMTALGTGSLGGTAPCNTADTEIYELTIFNPPGGNPILTLQRLSTGDTWSRTITTDLPALTTGLCLQYWRNTGATASIANIDTFGIVEDYNV